MSRTRIPCSQSTIFAVRCTGKRLFCHHCTYCALGSVLRMTNQPNSSQNKCTRSYFLHPPPPSSPLKGALSYTCWKLQHHLDSLQRHWEKTPGRVQAVSASNSAPSKQHTSSQLQLGLLSYGKLCFGEGFSGFVPGGGSIGDYSCAERVEAVHADAVNRIALEQLQHRLPERAQLPVHVRGHVSLPRQRSVAPELCHHLHGCCTCSHPHPTGYVILQQSYRTCSRPSVRRRNAGAPVSSSNAITPNDHESSAVEVTVVGMPA